MAFRGDGDRDFARRADRSAAASDRRRGLEHLRLARRRGPRPRSPMTLRSRRSSRCSTGPGDVGERLARLPLPEQRRADPARARRASCATRRRGRAVAARRRARRSASPAARSAFASLHPTAAGAAPRVPPLPRRRIRLRNDRLGLQRREVRAHLRAARAAPSSPSSTGSRPNSPLPDRARGLLRSAAAGSCEHADELGDRPAPDRRRRRVGRREPRRGRRPDGARPGRPAPVAPAARGSGHRPRATVRRPRLGRASSARASAWIVSTWTFYGDALPRRRRSTARSVRVAASRGRSGGPRARSRPHGRVDMLRDSGEAYARRLAGGRRRDDAPPLLGHTHGSSAPVANVGSGQRRGWTRSSHALAQRVAPPGDGRTTVQAGAVASDRVRSRSARCTARRHAPSAT